MIPKPLFQAFAAFVFLLFVFVAALILGGCKGPPEIRPGATEEVGLLIKAGGLRYATDPNTGNCFAYAWIGREGSPSDGAIVTWVPCSAERP